MLAILLLASCSLVAPGPPPIEWVPLEVPCEAGSCEVAEARRPKDAAVEVEGPVDLLGPAFEYRHQDTFGRVQTARGAKWPALLVRVTRSQGESRLDELHVVSVRDEAYTSVFSAVLFRSNPDGSGRSTTGTVRFERAGEGPLDIRLTQTGIGPRDQEPYRPGAPVEDHYTWDGSAYALQP